MKRIFTFIILTVFMSATVLTGCSSGELDWKSDLLAKMEYTQKDLSSTFSGATGQYDLVSDYLKSWANNNDILIVASEENYTVLSNPATEGCQGEKTTILQCPVETDNFANSLQILAISLTCLLGPENHGDISLIVTEKSDGEFLGASSVDPKYLKCDNFVNMQHTDDVQLYTSGAYDDVSYMMTDIYTDEPLYTQAYAITMSIAGHHDPYDFDNKYPNPIEVIGNLLATEKSAGHLFQLASFECETTVGYTPTSATAIVVIDANDVDSFNKKFRSSYNNMKKRFEKLEDNFVFTFTETAMPAQVMTNNTSDNIISLLYTLKTGIYLQDEDSGEIISASQLSHVTTTDNAFKLTIDFRSIDESILTEMSNVFLTTSGLCDIQYTPGTIDQTWPSKNNKRLVKYFTDALGSDDYVYDNSLKSSECDVLAKKTPLNIVSYRCNIQHSEAALSNVLNLLDTAKQNNAPEEQQ